MKPRNKIRLQLVGVVHIVRLSQNRQFKFFGGKFLGILFLIICAVFNDSSAQNQPDLDVKGIVDVINKTVGNNALIPNQNPKAVNSSDKKIDPTLSPPKTVNPSAGSKKENLSLMYSDEEMTKIQEALDALKDGKPLIFNNPVTSPSEDKVAAITPEDNAKSYVYLGSLLYNSPNNWLVWIDDQKISAADNRAGSELYIKSINEDAVDIVWTMSISKWKILANKKTEEGAPINKNNQVELNFTLSFNQTYMLNGNKTVEGRIAPLLTKIVDSKSKTVISDKNNTNSNKQ